jgi:hypothetical protein
MYRRMPLCGVYDGILGHLREDDSLRARAVKFHDARLEGEPLHKDRAWWALGSLCRQTSSLQMSGFC